MDGSSNRTIGARFMNLRLHIIFGALSVPVMVLAACGSAPSTQTASAGDPLAEPTSIGASEVGEAATVALSPLVEILVNGEGMTLYSVTSDTEGESTCYGGCAVTWPPLLTEGEPQAGEGIDPSLLGQTKRTDDSLQVTYNGMPLYLYSLDRAPGDMNGQGLGDVWFVVSPSGTIVEDITTSNTDIYDY